MPASTKTRLSVGELIAKYADDHAHASHVTALAIELFDATHALVGAPPDDRPLLEAACGLHDIGYRTNPRRHAEFGSRIVREEGLEGFTTAQRDDIAAAIGLHRAGLKLDTVARLRATSRRSRRLAAYLRIADGLDHTHIQDAAIGAVRPGPRAIRVSVRCRHGRWDLEAGRRKSDVWGAVFLPGLDLVRATAGPLRAAPLVNRELPPTEAARRLLFLYFRELVASAEKAVEGAGSEPLHRVRVAIRRMRAVLRAFRKPLAGTSARQLYRDLQHLNFVLGEVRDLDVWIDYLTSGPVRAQLGGHPRWAGFVAYQCELRRMQQVTIRRRLRGASFAALQARIGGFLRVELPRIAQEEPSEPLDVLARRVLAKALRRALKLSDLRRSTSAEELHRLRIALRRARHMGGFFGDIFGPPVAEIEKRLRAVERALGSIRDVDLALFRTRCQGPPPPGRLVLRLECRRKKARIALDKAWQRLETAELLADPSLGLFPKKP